MDTERKAFELSEPFTAEELVGLADSVRGRRRAAILAYANSLLCDQALAELIEASSEYFNKYLQDEADDDTGGWTGIHHEQYLAANRLKNAIARIGAKP